MHRFAIAKADDLGEHQTVKFQFVAGGRRKDGFVTRFGGEIVAYENSCQHIAINLDYGGEEFFSRDGKYILCQTHGAIYEPLSGLCVRGPCEGESLKRLRIEVEDGIIWLVGGTKPSS